jgi:hypothetical protein
MQKIDVACLPNLRAFAQAFRAKFGVALAVTEGTRSRPRQLQLWNEYQAYLARGSTPPYAALAAVPYTSRHDEVTHGNAVDLGSGIAQLDSVRSIWARTNGPKFGVVCTGINFRPQEPWHFEISTITTAGSSSTPIEEVDMTPEQAKTLDDINWMIGQMKPVLDNLNGANGGTSVQKKLDTALWALTDPTAGLRKMVADVQAKLAAATPGTDLTPILDAIKAIPVGSTATVDLSTVVSAIEANPAAVVALLKSKL